MSRIAVCFFALCTFGPAAVLLSLVNRTAPIAPDAAAAAAPPRHMGVNVERTKWTPPVTPKLRALAAPPRSLDARDPWNSEPLPEAEPGALRHRYVARPPRPIDMIDPWDPARSYAPPAEEIPGVILASL